MLISAVDQNFYETLARAFIYGLIPAFATSIGGLTGLIGLKASEKLLDIGLGFSAGVMLCTSLYELLLGSIYKAGVLTAVVGFLLGTIIIGVVEKLTPHEHIFKGYEGSSAIRQRLKTITLILLAIIIHNLPEGMAVGAASYIGLEEGLAVSLSIAIQDIPEGYVVSFALATITKKKTKSLLLAVLSGLSETIMAVITTLLASILEIEALLLGFAAGAMIYIINHEVIPETHRHGYEKLATAGFITGFIISLLLDQLVI